MLQAFFNGLSGLFAFSKGLDNVSNNVSNMNTPGFRGSDTFYRSMAGQDAKGLGARVAGAEMRTNAGDPKQTGNSTDLAISGKGYFVLRNADGERSFTRSGQFQVSPEGFLVDTVSRQKVAGISATGALVDISINDFRTLPPVPTSRVEVAGALARTGPADSSYKLEAVKVFDKMGETITVNVLFSQQTTPADTWEVKVEDVSGNSLGEGVLAFGLDGSPSEDSNKVTFDLADGQTITLEFGTPGSFNLTYQVASAGANSLQARVLDGSALAGLSTITFDNDGIVNFSYTNGETRKGQQIALASLADESGLVLNGSSLYQAPSGAKVTYGRATEGQYGRIMGGYIELSNVDLSQEFGDILIIQRGYQASSRVMTVSNEMLEQLYNSTRGG